VAAVPVAGPKYTMSKSNGVVLVSVAEKKTTMLSALTGTNAALRLWKTTATPCAKSGAVKKWLSLQKELLSLYRYKKVARKFYPVQLALNPLKPLHVSQTV